MLRQREAFEDDGCDSMSSTGCDLWMCKAAKEIREIARHTPCATQNQRELAGLLAVYDDDGRLTGRDCRGHGRNEESGSAGSELFVRSPVDLFGFSSDILCQSIN